MTKDDLTMPGMMAKSTSQMLDYKDYRIRYYKANLSSPEDLMMLENLTTEGIKGENIVVLGTDKYSFQRDFFVVLTYAEKRQAETPASAA